MCLYASVFSMYEGVREVFSRPFSTAAFCCASTTHIHAYWKNSVSLSFGTYVIFFFSVSLFLVLFDIRSRINSHVADNVISEKVEFDLIVLICTGLAS